MMSCPSTRLSEQKKRRYHRHDQAGQQDHRRGQRRNLDLGLVGLLDDGQVQPPPHGLHMGPEEPNRALPHLNLSRWEDIELRETKPRYVSISRSSPGHPWMSSLTA